MPTVSMFFGILIKFNYNDHLPPHFHAEYQGHNAMFGIDGTLIEGSLPPRQTKLVLAWATLHEDELLANWRLARDHEELFRIDPLK